MSNTDNAGQPESSSTIHMLLSKMRPWQITILTTMLIVPIVIALSGLILQVNVGAIIQAILTKQLSQSREQTVSAIEISLDQRVAELAAQLQTSGEATARQLAEMRTAVDGLVREVSGVVGRADALEGRFNTLEGRVGRIERWACDNDRAVGFGNCVLDQEPTP